MLWRYQQDQRIKMEEILVVSGKGIVESLTQNLWKLSQRFANPDALLVHQDHENDCAHIRIRHIRDQRLIGPQRALGGIIRPSVHIIRGRRIQSPSIWRQLNGMVQLISGKNMSATASLPV